MNARKQASPHKSEALTSSERERLRTYAERLLLSAILDLIEEVEESGGLEGSFSEFHLWAVLHDDRLLELGIPLLSEENDAEALRSGLSALATLASDARGWYFRPLGESIMRFSTQEEWLAVYSRWRAEQRLAPVANVSRSPN